MNVEIITIGDELLIGQVIDTNSAWIARELNKIGWEVIHIATVRDREEEMTAAFDQAFSRADIVLVTGGLGPTQDDVTKQTLCRYFGGQLVQNPEVLKNICDLFSKRRVALNGLTANQALVPDNCVVIQNRVGTAPVMWFERGRQVLISMPGVPSEMKWAMTSEVMPRLLSRFADGMAIVHHTCLVKGYTESALAIHLEDFEQNLPSFIKLAYLPSPGVIRLRLTARGYDEKVLSAVLSEEVKRLNNALGSANFCDEDMTLAGALGELLAKRGLTLSTAESCTGGNIAHEVTLVPGCSTYYKGSVVSYANEVKTGVLQVSIDDLQKYGAVSQQVVGQMAEGVARLLQTDCAIATSGIAGPEGGSPDKPVGTVWIAVKCGSQLKTACYQVNGGREYNITRFTQWGLLLLVDMLTESVEG